MGALVVGGRGGHLAKEALPFSIGHRSHERGAWFVFNQFCRNEAILQILCDFLSDYRTIETMDPK